ncbi:hypothetical protein, partial [Chamaesiphon sp. OTE_75_metabat_556]|uniref:hypothetical protein n=1 Tax=Chamaesiphon sp. OTE_75_metabat_556 TaxID=2964692 RepID=UPI00286A4A71
MTELSILLVIALIVGTAISIGYAIQAQENMEAARRNEQRADKEFAAAKRSQEETLAALRRVEEEQGKT